MTCPRCRGDIHIPAEYEDDCEALFSLVLLHDRDDCTAPQHNHVSSGVYGGCPACGTDLVPL